MSKIQLSKNIQKLSKEEYNKTWPNEKNYKYIKRQNDPRFGDISILKGQRGDIIFSKEKMATSEKEATNDIQNLKTRMRLNDQNILQMLGYSTAIKKELCSTHYLTKGFYIFPRSDLYKELKDQKKTLSSFSNNELQKITSESLQGLQSLHQKKLHHGDIRPQYIGYDKNTTHTSILDRFKDPSPLERAQTNNIVNKKELYMSPQLYKRIKGSKNQVYNVQKNDLYSLGMSLLHVGTQDSVQDCYMPNGEIRQEVVDQHLQDFGQRYQQNPNLVNCVQTLLQQEEPNRGDASQLLNGLQGGFNNQYQQYPVQTDLNTFQQPETQVQAPPQTFTQPITTQVQSTPQTFTQPITQVQSTPQDYFNSPPEQYVQSAPQDVPKKKKLILNMEQPKQTTTQPIPTYHSERQPTYIYSQPQPIMKSSHFVNTHFQNSYFSPQNNYVQSTPTTKVYTSYPNTTNSTQAELKQSQNSTQQPINYYQQPVQYQYHNPTPQYTTTQSYVQNQPTTIIRKSIIVNQENNVSNVPIMKSVERRVSNQPITIRKSVDRRVQNQPIVIRKSVGRTVSNQPIIIRKSVDRRVQNQPVTIRKSIVRRVSNQPITIRKSVSRMTDQQPIIVERSISNQPQKVIRRVSRVVQAPQRSQTTYQNHQFDHLRVDRVQTLQNNNSQIRYVNDTPNMNAHNYQDQNGQDNDNNQYDDDNEDEITNQDQGSQKKYAMLEDGTVVEIDDSRDQLNQQCRLKSQQHFQF